MSSLTETLNRLFFRLPSLGRIAIILVFLIAMAIIAKRKRLLTASGIAAALPLGFIVFYIAGASGIFIFLFFFVTASAVSKVTAVPVDVVVKEGPRDWAQVAANGVPAAIALLLWHFQGWPEIYLVAFSAALAEAEADTFASSFGIMSGKPPRSIITGTLVPPGISGGVTMLGSAAGLLGAFLMALLHITTYGPSFASFTAVLVSGFAGCLFDSILGGTLQVQYRAPDGTLTEKSEIDGRKLERVRGIPFIDNDTVNFLSGLFSASLSMLIYSIMR